MADVVRTGAIFRVKNATPMRSPMPRLPVARGRITSATPETPAGKRSDSASRARARSALERVVPRAACMAPPPPSRSQAVRTTSRRKSGANKSGVVERNGPSADKTQATMLANFNRIVSESETRRAAQRGEEEDASLSEEQDDEDDNNDDDDDDDEEEFGSDAMDELHVTQRGKRRKPPRVEPDVEPMESVDDVYEEEEEDASSSEEMVTPQPRRKRESSSSDEHDGGASDATDDSVQVQKRLLYDDDTPPPKGKPAAKPKDQLVKTAKRATKKPAPAKTGKATTPAKKVRVSGGGGLEFLSMSSAPTPSRSTRIRTGVLVMSEWYLDWPPYYEGDQMQLVIHGQVLGQHSTFTVLRRVTDVQFVSTDNQNVRLNGCLDIEQAQRADVPPVVMELLVEGLPANWRQLLEAYAPPPDPWMPMSVKSKEKAKRKRAKDAAAAAAAEAEHTSVAIPGVTPSKKPTKPTASSANKSPACRPVTPGTEKRSRSGRRLTPVMEWWRNERKVVDANFETKIEEGSPAYLPSKRTAMSDAAKAARLKIQEIYEAQRKSAEWSDSQLAALHDAKTQVPTTDLNFWGEVAKLVPGKSADECRARSFEDLRVPATRKGAGGGGTKSTAATKQSQVPVKIHRAGSNLFKKQSTPSKDELAGATGLDDLKSPGAPAADDTRNRDDDDSDDEGVLGGAGRELLEKVSLSKRDDVDSYVRNLKRGHDGLGIKAVRSSSAPATDFMTPQAKKKPRREGVHMTTEVGTHMIEAIVTPNGTTRVRVEKGSDDDDDVFNEYEDDEEAALSDAF